MLKDIFLRSLLPSLCELCCHPVNILYVYERLGELIDRWHMWRAEQTLCSLTFHIALKWVYIHCSSLSGLELLEISACTYHLAFRNIRIGT